MAAHTAFPVTVHLSRFTAFSVPAAKRAAKALTLAASAARVTVLAARRAGRAAPETDPAPLLDLGRIDFEKSLVDGDLRVAAKRRGICRCPRARCRPKCVRVGEVARLSVEASARTRRPRGRARMAFAVERRAGRLAPAGVKFQSRRVEPFVGQRLRERGQRPETSANFAASRATGDGRVEHERAAKSSRVTATFGGRAVGEGVDAAALARVRRPRARRGSGCRRRHEIATLLQNQRVHGREPPARCRQAHAGMAARPRAPRTSKTHSPAAVFAR